MLSNEATSLNSNGANSSKKAEGPLFPNRMQQSAKYNLRENHKDRHESLYS